MQTPSRSATTTKQARTTVNASQLPTILKEYAGKIKILSLDCFDTLIWRKVAEPKDVFYEMQQRQAFKELGITAYQRIKAAARAYRAKFITEGHRQITLADIYKFFTSISPTQQTLLAEEELLTEIELSYAFQPMIELIREAHQQGINIIIVSDTYLNANQLKRILSKCLPADVMALISQVFCSSEHKKYKSEGLFEIVKNTLNQTSESILHIGDHPIADAEAPRQQGIHAIQFLQFTPPLNNFLRLQHNAFAIASLASIENNKQIVRYSPFRGALSLAPTSTDSPETKIGYLSFGPIMYAFARFVTDEINALKQAGKRPKVFFLLRDAYLLHRACEAYAGEPVGKLVRLRKFTAVAASFQTQADVDHYLSSIAPEHFNMVVICEQLLLPRNIIDSILGMAQRASDPEQTLYQLLHQQPILQTIFKNSAAYRERLRKYIEKEMALEPGDTAVLVDTGYIGVTQEYLTRTFQSIFQTDIVGLYFMGSHEPDRPNCKSLLTSTWCEHGLLEQSCTFKEGCVLDYDQDGNPVFDRIRLSDDQYNRVEKLQSECLRFISDAKKFFLASNLDIPYTMLQKTAMAALQRHIFLPTQDEIRYFERYQHDKDMGPDGNKTIYNINEARAKLTFQRQPKLHPYEIRSTNPHLTLSTLLQRGFNIDFNDHDANAHDEQIAVVVKNGEHVYQVSCPMQYTNHGYYSITTPAISKETIGILLGEKFNWLQITQINLIAAQPHTLQLSQNNIVIDKMMNHGGDLFQCLDQTGILILTPPESPTTIQPFQYQIILRPITRRN